MSPLEAAWFGEVLCQVPAADLSPILNLGSSTLAYRTTERPHIERLLFRPLRERGVRILNVDLKEDRGVDIVGNILDPHVRSHIAALGVRAILCNNLLEHVTDIRSMCEAVAATCPMSGVLGVSVPFAYPFHPDPIDNGFRPSLDELMATFAPFGFRLIRGEIIRFDSYAKSIVSKPMLLIRDLYLLSVAPFNKPRRRVLLGNYGFLFRNFQVTCAVFRKDR